MEQVLSWDTIYKLGAIASITSLLIATSARREVRRLQQRLHFFRDITKMIVNLSTLQDDYKYLLYGGALDDTRVGNALSRTRAVARWATEINDPVVRKLGHRALRRLFLWDRLGELASFTGWADLEDSSRRHLYRIWSDLKTELETQWDKKA